MTWNEDEKYEAAITVIGILVWSYLILVIWTSYERQPFEFFKFLIYEFVILSSILAYLVIIELIRVTGMLVMGVLRWMYEWYRYLRSLI